MRLVLFSLLVLCESVLWAQTKKELSELRLDIPSSQLSVREAIALIESRGVHLSYSSSYLDLDQTMEVRTGPMTLKTFLRHFLPDERLLFLADKVLIRPPKWRRFSGFVRDRDTGEALIGALIYDSNRVIKGVSNAYGYFSVMLPWESTSGSCSYMGYKPLQFSLTSASQTLLLHQDPINLKEVVIVPKVEKEPLAASVLTIRQADYAPTLLGVDDVMQRMQGIAGVTSQGLFQPFSVRSDRADNNLVLLDGIPVNHYLHLFSLYSIFDSQVIQKATLYKGFFPVNTDGALSGVLDIRTKDGHKSRFGGALNIDLLTLSAMIEGPIKKDHSSFLFSFRRSWLDASSLFSLGSSDESLLHASAFDLFFKFSSQHSPRNRFYFSSYLGGDRFEVGESDQEGKSFIKWNTILAALRWTHVVSDSWFLDTNLSYSSLYNRSVPLGLETNPDARFQSRLSTLGLGSQIEGPLSEKIKLNLGYKLDYKRYSTPLVAVEQSGVPLVVTKDQASIKASLYGGVEYDASERLNLIGGFNYAGYLFDRTPYSFLQPRLQAVYKLNRDVHLFVGGSMMAQFDHQITMAHLSTPYELRLPSSDKVSPARSLIVEAGAKGNLTSRLSFSTSIYYKRLSNLVNYRVTQDIENLHLAVDPSNRIVQGDGRGFGFELESDYVAPRWRIKTAYTFSAMKERYPDLSDGDYRISKNNRPHLFHTALSWAVSKKSLLTTQVVMGSGSLIRYPVHSLPAVDEVLNGAGEGSEQSYYTQRLTKRLPSSYQLDLGYTITMKGFSKQDALFFKAGVYNLLNNHNTIYHAPVIEEERVQISLNSLTSMMPYVGFTYKF